ncbi:MAG: class I SAM-dependent DNA methyltransferase [Actinomycetota bacterium]|nr:class I SAM-dependent DNA methyltransferase [Actinomycetota bacterium]
MRTTADEDGQRIRLSEPRMTPQQFSAKWADNELKESAASKEHFLDVCALVGAPTPREADKSGEWYAFEKGVEKGALAGAGTKKSKKQGFADVFLQGCFAWEYKGPHKDLTAAYAQLQLYRDALQNPPLLIVSDMDRFVVRTNFNDMPVAEFPITNEGIGSDGGEAVALLKAAFSDPYSLRPGRTREAITEEVAERFGLLARGLRERGEEPHRAAHFLVKLVFCLFAEDVGLLPEGLFGEMIQASISTPERFPERAHSLFRAMAEPGGEVNWKPIRHFNGGLFADDVALALTRQELGVLRDAAKLDWGSVEPAVLGTLFERSLDPDKRSQLGAQYTGKDDILRVVEPVLMAPLRREWERVRGEVEADATAELPQDRSARTKAVNRIEGSAQERLEAFARKVRSTRVLDPACGSGNFLYVSLSLLLDMEKEVSIFAGRYGRGPFFPEVGPEQVFGIERDPYAHDLAQVSVWIGYLQWLNQNGFGSPPDPVLGPMRNVVEMNAILRTDEDGNAEPEWPEADVVVGNPPFLGSRRMRPVLGGEYCEALTEVYAGRVEGLPDLVCYWFERARRLIEEGRLQRAGLIATQAIRNGANRKVLENIKTSGDIFMAWSDEPWVLDGAAVRIAMVGFDDGSEQEKVLNGEPVPAISARLRAGVDLTEAPALEENKRIASQGMVMRGPFDIDAEAAKRMLEARGNPNGLPNSDVVRPRRNARDVTQRSRGGYAVDFGVGMPIEQAAGYEAPFAYVKEHVYPERQKAQQAAAREKWWIFWNPRPRLREAIAPLSRYAVTPRVAKHRVFAWLGADVVPDTRLIAFAREDDYFFGVLHSRPHEVWALEASPRHGVGNDPTYNHGDCFETFPFPWPLGTEPSEGDDPRVEQIAAASRALVGQRDRWLNPEDLPQDELKKRTLTNLYNDRPSWLELAHAALDRAVYAAYGWPEEIGDEEILKNLLALNLERSS